MHWVYYFGRFLIHLVVLPFANWRVTGRENVREKGPFIIVCNHLHLADPPMIAASLKLKTVFLAKEDLFRDGWSRFWVSNFGAIPVNRNGMDREAIRQAESWLKRGVSVIIFPEGGRSPNARLQQAFPGAALIAARTGLPILPVSIAGSDKFKDLWWCFRHRPEVTINIGRPFRPAFTGDSTPREQRQRLTADIMARIAALLPPRYRGAYGGDDVPD
jgi:1-acyl-sn-glycerol-3-phosphate acyltransferase